MSYRPPYNTPDFRILETSASHAPCSGTFVYQSQNPSICCIPCKNLHQPALVDGVKELFQVHIHCPHFVGIQVFSALFQCLMGAPLWAEAIAYLYKFQFIDWRQYPCDCLLNDTVSFFWDSQFLSLSIILLYFYPSARLQLVLASRYGLSDFLDVVFEILQKFINSQPIGSACPFVLLHALVSLVKIFAAHDFLQFS